MSDFPVHTGKQRRGPRAAEIDAMQKRRRGSEDERETAARMYEPYTPTSIACLKKQCRSPVACGGFGYCREKNFA